MRSLYWLAVPLLAGCTQNPYLLQTQNQSLTQQRLALEQRSRELEGRATTLDKDNQELQTLLAQSRQQTQLMEDQLAAVREQLSSATAQLSNTTVQLGQLQQDKQQVERQSEQLVAATRRRGGATITANNSVRRSLSAMNLPGLEVRPDGDVVRIELPSAKLFPGGSTLLTPAGTSLIDACASEVGRVFPGQIIGIEGHTDNEPVRSPGGNHQLSVARAMAVYQHLTSRGQFPPGQLFVAAHGGNHPVVSNATPAGHERNNRVELVVYPEKSGGP
jgi:flagellar motor protein MotB